MNTTESGAASARRALRPAAGWGRTLLTLEKGLRVLSLFDAEHQEWSLRQLGEATGESKTNILRIVKTMEAQGYLVRDPGSRTLRLGGSVARLSYMTLSHSELIRIAVPRMCNLAEALGETVDLMVEVEIGCLMSLYYVSPRFPGAEPSMGKVTQPGVSTAASKLFVAFRPEDSWDEILEAIVKPVTDRTITDLAELRRELAAARQEGVAYDRMEWSVELCGVGAPVFGRTGRIAGCVSVVSPSGQSDDERMVRHANAVRETTADISENLGAPAERVAFLRNRRS